MALKTEMFTPVLAWLDAGAPHTTAEGLIFNMECFKDTEGYITDCGTSCCIAGAIDAFNALGVADDVVPKGMNASNAKCEQIGVLVGMNEKQIQDLFMAANNTTLQDNDDRARISPAEAASAIRSMLTTGEVVWPDGGFRHHLFSINA